MTKILTADPMAPDDVLLPVTRGPRTGPVHPQPPAAVSFGYGTLNRLPENGTLDLTGVTYDPVRGLNLDTSGEPMTLMPITMASSTKANTTEDHQTWTDSDTD